MLGSDGRTWPEWFISRIVVASQPADRATSCGVSAAWYRAGARAENWAAWLWQDFRHAYDAALGEGSPLKLYCEQWRYHAALRRGHMVETRCQLPAAIRVVPKQLLWSSDRCDVVVIQPRPGHPEVHAARIREGPGGVAVEVSTLFCFSPPKTKDYDALRVILHSGKIFVATLDDICVHDLGDPAFPLLARLPLPQRVVSFILRSINGPHFFDVVMPGNPDAGPGHVVLIARTWVVAWDAGTFEEVHCTEVPGLDLSYLEGWGTIGKHVYSRARPRPAGLPGDEVLLVDMLAPAEPLRVPFPVRLRELAADTAAIPGEALLVVAIDVSNTIHAWRCALGSPPMLVASVADLPPLFLSPSIDLFHSRFAAVAGCTDGTTLFVWDTLSHDRSCRRRTVDIAAAGVHICADLLLLSTVTLGPNSLLAIDALSLGVVFRLASHGVVSGTPWGFVTLGDDCRSLGIWRPARSNCAAVEGTASETTDAHG